jgi:hypothetical protein
MITRTQTSASLALVIMAVFATVTTTSISFAMPVLALGNEPSGIADLSGAPTNLEIIDPRGLKDRAIENEYASMHEGGDETATDGLPSDEMNADNAPTKGGDIGGLGPTDEREGEEREGVDNSRGSMESRGVGYEELQDCLSDIEGEGTPTEQQVQDCIDSSYSGVGSSDNAPAVGKDGNDKENSVTKHVSTDDIEEVDEEDEEDEEDEDFDQ